MKEQSLTKYGKILLISQMWAGDLVQMNHLMRLVADLEPFRCITADILLYPRRDTNCREFTSESALKAKFDTFWGRSKRNDVGWPTGPNGVAMDALADTHEMWSKGEFPYDCAMLIEADCIPTRAGWHKEILDEFNSSGKLVLGHWDGQGMEGPPKAHMNGNLVFHPSIIELFPHMAYGKVPPWGWDMAFWNELKHHAAPSRLIYSDYRLNTPNNPWKGCEYLFEPKYHRSEGNPLKDEPLQPAWIHGVKKIDGIECVRKKLLT